MMKTLMPAIKNSSERGVSLIAVMWIVAILTVLASEFMYSMQLEIRIAKNWSDQVSAFYAAKAGLESAIIALKDDQAMASEMVEQDAETAAAVGYDGLDENWAQEIAGELNDSTYQTTVTDEAAKINVNTTDEETLTKAITYCMGDSDDMMEEETTAQAQTLAAAVIEKRPYRTVAEMAKATDMTPELLYGASAMPSDSVVAEEVDEEERQSTPLLTIATIYSAEKNATSDGGRRANINSGDAQQIQQAINPEGQEIITQQEAQAIVDYGNAQGNNQQGQGQGQGQDGEQQPQGEPAQGGGQPEGGEQPGGGQANQSGYTGIGQLLDVPAISQQTFDSISGSITVDSDEDEGEGGGRGGGGGGGDMTNINAADANELQNLDGIDSGIAESIVNYRNQNQFGSTEDIMQVKAVSIEDMKTIADRAAISDEEILKGKVNINTAPLEILIMLPGMDEDKAQAIIARRGVAEGQTSTTVSSQQGNQEAAPFTSVGQLLDVEGIDENTFKSLVDHVSCRSAVFKITSEGRSLDGKIIQSCIAVVDRGGNRVKTIYWKQE